MFNSQPKQWILSFNKKSLRLIIFVTEQCNFRCVYCYEDFKIGKIEAEVLEGIYNYLEKRIPEISLLQVSYFGGEPLMNKKAIYDISSFAKKMCEENNVVYWGDITTNGYSLDFKTFERLFSLNLRTYQVTLDGSKETHDKLRPAINGKSTFDKILNNLLDIKKSDIQAYIMIRLNVSDENYDSVLNFISEYGVLFAFDKRFVMHFHPIFGMDNLKLSNLTEKVSNLKDVAAEYGLVSDNAYEEGVCYASKANNYVIRANGKLQKCTVALNDEINNIGRITPEGEMIIDEAKLNKWIHAEDKGCPLQSLKMEKLAVPYENAGKYV